MVTVESQTRRIARIKRVELLDAALVELADHGWRGLQMQAVANRGGVSRQTVYYTFSNRDGLASAMVAHLSERFLDGFDAAFSTGDTAEARWRAGVRHLLEQGRDDPALRAMLGADSGDRFLELLTSRSAPLVARARERIPATVWRYQPELSAVALAQVADLVARLVLSQVVQPMTDIPAAVGAVTSMICGFLAGPAGTEESGPG